MNLIQSQNAKKAQSDNIVQPPVQSDNIVQPSIEDNKATIQNNGIMKNLSSTHGNLTNGSTLKCHVKSANGAKHFS